MKARNTHIGKKSRDWLRVVYGVLVVDMLQADFSLFLFISLLSLRGASLLKYFG